MIILNLDVLNDSTRIAYKIVNVINTSEFISQTLFPLLLYKPEDYAKDNVLKGLTLKSIYM